MIHSSFSMLLRVCAGLLLFAFIGCKKGLPGKLPCDCDTMPGEDRRFSHMLAPCGTLLLPIDSTLENIYVISAFLGPEEWGRYAPLELHSDATIPFFHSSAIQIQSIGWRFSVDAEIKDLHGNLLVQMMDDKWYVYTRNISKYNYDARGLEIFDKQGRIAFSIDLKLTDFRKVSLDVQGIIPLADSTVQFYNTDAGPWFPFKYGTPALDSVINMYYGGFPIKPLFRYTGPNWQHARVSPAL